MSFRLAHGLTVCGILLTMLQYNRPIFAGPSSQGADSGYSVTQWREWPNESRLDIAFPQAIGAEIIPLPTGLQELPLPKAARVAAPVENESPESGHNAASSPASLPSTDMENSSVLTVYVPYDAKVAINGLETRSKGSRRRYVSYGLKPGFSYKYVIRSQIVRDGQVFEDTRTITLVAGACTGVSFGFNVLYEINGPQSNGQHSSKNENTRPRDSEESLLLPELPERPLPPEGLLLPEGGLLPGLPPPTSHERQEKH